MMKLLLIDLFIENYVCFILFIHIIISIIVSLFFVKKNFKLEKDNYKSIVVIVFIFHLFLPFVASFGLIVFSKVIKDKKNNFSPFQIHKKPKLPNHPVRISQRTIYSEGGLRIDLNDSSDSSNPIGTLIATSFLLKKDRIKLLSEALKSEDEDTRLLSYSILKNLKKEQLDIIQQKESDLSKIVNRNNFSEYKTLLFDYKTIVLNNLVSESQKDYYTKKAIQLSYDLLSIKQEGELFYTIGKLSIELNQLDTAEKYIFKASNCERPISMNIILSVLAEISYLKKDYHQVKFYLNELKIKHTGNVNLFAYKFMEYKLINFWT